MRCLYCVYLLSFPVSVTQFFVRFLLVPIDPAVDKAPSVLSAKRRLKCTAVLTDLCVQAHKPVLPGGRKQKGSFHTLTTA